jgi:hypothetical protein
MESYAILNNRKRAIIALVHSIISLVIAGAGLGSRPKAGLLLPQHAFTAGNIAIFCVYLIVSSVLVILTGYSRGLKERTYFGFCSASASVGLLRALFGDPIAHVGPIARVFLLATAVLIGFATLAAHSQTQTQTLSTSQS